MPGDGDAGLDDHNGDGDADDHDGGSCDGVDGCIEEDTFGLFKLLPAIFLPQKIFTSALENTMTKSFTRWQKFQMNAIVKARMMGMVTLQTQERVDEILHLTQTNPWIILKNINKYKTIINKYKMCITNLFWWEWWHGRLERELTRFRFQMGSQSHY